MSRTVSCPGLPCQQSACVHQSECAINKTVERKRYAYAVHILITADPESTVTRTVFDSIRQIVIGKPANSDYTNLGCMNVRASGLSCCRQR